METAANVRAPSENVPEPLWFRKQNSPIASTRSRKQPEAYHPSGMPEATHLRKPSVEVVSNASRHQIDHQHSHSRINSYSAMIDRSSDDSLYSTKTSYISYKPPVMISEFKEQSKEYVVDDSSEILGNFVVITSPQTGERLARKMSLPEETVPNRSKYTFDASPLFDDLHRQTTVSTSLDNHPHRHQALSPRPTSLHLPSQTPKTRMLQRSESSPHIVPARFRTESQTTSSPSPSPNPDISRYYYGEDDPPVASKVRASKTVEVGRGRTQLAIPSDLGTRDDIHSETSSGRSAEAASSRRQGGTSQKHEIYSRSSATSRNGNRYAKHTTKNSLSSTTGRKHHARTAGDTMCDIEDPFANDFDGSLEESNYLSTYQGSYVKPTTEVKKRSRSPMKKMFGDKGWLGHSPSEVNDIRVSDTSAPVERKQEAPAKMSMIGRLKQKLDKVAEKADMAPGKVDSNNLSRVPVLTVSLGPPEQARIYMELELMLAHTANSFLMSQFSQGRIAIDSIKKTVDGWKAKGRPSVLEFMYDQGTQRDLVAINQNTFQFHGDRASDSVRVNSMLYNWKQIASHMAIRTFCSSDSVILKLIFDIGQILELLGAVEGLVSRYQNIRMSVNDKVQVARRKKRVEAKFEHGRELSWDARHPEEAFSFQHASHDVCGGMKLIPE